MTLVSPRNEHVLPVMLNVQQQHMHVHRHHGYPGPAPSPVHRGNVIVAANGGVEGKVMQQQTGPCKRSKVYNQTTPYGSLPHQPASVARRNARERNRVKQVNNGFAELRERIPQSIAQALGGSSGSAHGGSRAGSKKLSKVETLRMAVEYIRSLQRLLEEHDGTNMNASTSSSVSSASSTCGSVLLSEPDLGAEMRLHQANLASDLGHQHHHHYHHHHSMHQRQVGSPTAFAMAPCSEASSSPTPSFISEASSGGSQGYGPPSSALYEKNDYYTEKAEYYSDSGITPEDEELLDAITLWQESQS